MILLTEQLQPTAANIIEEASKDGQNLFLTGVFMQGGIRNRNNREYPVNELSRAVQEASQQIASNGGIFGELDHPQTLTINMDRISHVITDLKMEGNNAVGRARLLETPMGKIGKELLKSGVRTGVSSRGAGTVDDGGVVTGFNLITVDLVVTPSAPGAMPNTVYESLQQSLSGRTVLTLAEQLQQDPSAQKYFIKEFNKWLGDLLNKK